MTTTDNVTKAQIEQLRTEAGAAGDTEQVRLCDVALRSWAEREWVDETQIALGKCVQAIQAAEAME